MLSKDLETKLVVSGSYDPWYNLALEEYLLSGVIENQVILYLWQNDNTVVIGKNQNAWKECRWQQLEKDGGKLARRLSGGGAVYHDLGNLNFTFIMREAHFNLEDQLQVILDAVKKLGIDASFSGRNDLVAGGRKFSGNAFYQNGISALHHGTILIHSDIDKLTQYLMPAKTKLQSKGIDSVRSRVVNLIEVKKGLRVDEVRDAVIKAFSSNYGSVPAKESFSEMNTGLGSLYDKYKSWEWRFGETPEFEIDLQERFEWGSIEIGINLQEGCVHSVKVYSDAMDYTLASTVERVLEGLQFKAETIVCKLDQLLGDGKNISQLGDIRSWFARMEI